MKDRELLELAAKAAGIQILEWRTDDGGYPVGTNVPGRDSYPWCWNPLKNDGDAQRLVVKLKMCFGPNVTEENVVCFDDNCNNLIEPLLPDPYAATRRVIVRVAAEIGKAMP